ncbi:hypothetical protein FHG87_019809 [Trinorchestia longiramus]|nr:hypothetical protein FHG87_019809 [Trinorchestia longiramus]
MTKFYHQLGRLVSESACERKDPGSNPAADMVDVARNTAWDLGKKPNNYRSNYPTQEWARRFVPIASFYSILLIGWLRVLLEGQRVLLRGQRKLLGRQRVLLRKQQALLGEQRILPGRKQVSFRVSPSVSEGS